MNTETSTSEFRKEPPLFPEGLPESKVRNYLLITDPDLVDSFLDPVRRAILVTLRNGIDSKKNDSFKETIEREDGTKVTTTVLEEKLVKRFWMTVPEIVDNNIGETPVSKFNCYYHLPKLIEQGLVEEYIPEGKESTSKRGIYYRRTAKVFIVSSSKLSGDIVKSYLTLFEKGFEVCMDDKTRTKFEDLLVKQVKMIDDATEYLAVHMKEVEIDSTSLSDMLSVMASVYLSDNEEFLRIQRELKKAALTPCCGTGTDMKLICADCGDTLDPETVLIRKIDGKNLSFCDDDCAASFMKGRMTHSV